MITQEELANIVYVIEYHLNGYSNIEIDAYKKGSYYTPQRHRNGLGYLELYYLVLNHSLELSVSGFDYSNFGIETSDLIYIIDKSNELMFYYGKLDLP